MTARAPSLLDALLPIGVLVVLLSLSVYLFGDASSSGPNQIALMSAAFVAGLVGLKNGLRWAEIEEGILAGIHMAMKANLILLAVGALIGTWILAGTVPTMIWLGLKLISAEYFYLTSCLICALTALSIGSSWTVAGTLGIGLMGVAAGLGLDPGDHRRRDHFRRLLRRQAVAIVGHHQPGPGRCRRRSVRAYPQHVAYHRTGVADRPGDLLRPRPAGQRRT